jgi:ribosomal protein S18 acetylase RimI-like enzyme
MAEDRADEWAILFCTEETFRPFHMDCVRWWSWSEWEDYYRMTDGMWPSSSPHTREDWEHARREGYTYCAAIVDGRNVATAAVWRRSDDEWEVAAVGTAPGFRRRGYGKAVVSFITDHIIAHGRTATIGARPGNVAMLETARSVGFRSR